MDAGVAHARVPADPQGLRAGEAVAHVALQAHVLGNPRLLSRVLLSAPVRSLRESRSVSHRRPLSPSGRALG